jgi:hypothetical protein
MTRTFKEFYEDFLEDRMEIFVGFIGLIVMTALIITSLILAQNYNILENTVSSLGTLEGRFFFSVGFVIGGSLGIPFFIFLDKSVLANFDYIEDNVLIHIRKPIRRFTTAAAVITCVCIALVGILPDPGNPYSNLFDNFHRTVAGISFFGTSVYIFAYSILLIKQQGYETTLFSKFHPILGILIFVAGIVILPVLSLMSLFTLAEWILTILLFLWLFLTSSHLLFNKEIKVLLKVPFPKKLEKSLLKYEDEHKQDKLKLANMYENIGTIHKRLENIDLAKQYIKKAIDEFNSMNIPKLEKRINSLERQLKSLEK